MSNTPTIQELIEEKAMSCAGYVNPIQAARECAAFASTLYDKQLAESLALYNNQTQEIIKRDQEIDRLKGLLKQAIIEISPLAWDAFKEQNNIK